MTDLANQTLADLVVERPAAASVLERYGLDYCCHGDRSLAAACAEAGVDGTTVAGDLDALADLDAPGSSARAAWASLDAAALTAHIVEQHHRYLHEELPLLDALAEKVLSVHRSRHPELAEVRRLVAAVRADLEPHLLKEERILFPAIQALAGGRREFAFGSVANPIRAMAVEHDRAGELLAELRRVTDGYTTPADGCASYESLYERLALLEADTHEHIHKENNVLFPAALRMADAAERTPS